MDITRFVVDRVVEKTYYGNAEPEGKTVVVGGKETVAEGWTAYTATQRGARWTADPRNRKNEPKKVYGGRTYITGQDAVESLVTSRCRAQPKKGGAPPDPLARAAARLARALETAGADGGLLAARPVVISTVTPNDVRALGLETDTSVLHSVAASIAAVAGTRAPPSPPKKLPALPEREVPLQGKPSQEVNQAIIALEQEVIPRATAIEAYRGVIAAVFDEAATALSGSVN